MQNTTKQILVIQTGVFGRSKSVQEAIERTFPDIAPQITYVSNFEEAIGLVPAAGEIVVITSNVFHDAKDILYPGHEKNGSRLAEIVKAKNKESRVYVFSSEVPIDKKHIDGVFLKSGGGWKADEDIVEAFYEFGLARRPKVPGKLSILVSDIWGEASWFTKFLLVVTVGAILYYAFKLALNYF